MNTLANLCWKKLHLLLIACCVYMASAGNHLSAAEQPNFPDTLTIGILPEQNIFVQLERYEHVSRYLSDELGITVNLKILARYGNIIDNFNALNLDGAFFGSFTYALAHSRIDLEPLARPTNLDGTSTYHGVILARKDSNIQSISDMKGKTFAFVDKATTAGYLLPMAVFSQEGISDYPAYFKETYFTGTHEDVIMDIVNGKADAGAAKNTVFERLVLEKPSILKELVILYRSPKVPSNGLSLKKELPANLRSKVKKILLQMTHTARGKEVLANFKAQAFIETTQADYQPVFDYAKQIDLDLATYTHYRN